MRAPSGTGRGARLVLRAFRRSGRSRTRRRSEPRPRRLVGWCPRRAGGTRSPSRSFPPRLRSRSATAVPARLTPSTQRQRRPSTRVMACKRLPTAEGPSHSRAPALPHACPPLGVRGRSATNAKTSSTGRLMRTVYSLRRIACPPARPSPQHCTAQSVVKGRLGSPTCRTRACPPQGTGGQGTAPRGAFTASRSAFICLCSWEVWAHTCRETARVTSWGRPLVRCRSAAGAPPSGAPLAGRL